MLNKTTILAGAARGHERQRDRNKLESRAGGDRFGVVDRQS